MELSNGGVVGISIGSFVLGLLLCFLVMYFCKKRTLRGRRSLRGRPIRKGNPNDFRSFFKHLHDH